MIEIIDLFFHYPDGKQVLDRINLTITPGEKVAIIGPNGAGKSTLLLHFNGILQGEGQVKVDGLEISKKNLRVIRAKVGMVFQNPDDQLFSLTIAEDVAYGPAYQGLDRAVTDQKVKASLAAVNLVGFEERHPYHLSGGEKKRASIATVLSMDPDYLVMDEPTSGLDPKSRRELIALLKKLPQTLILATHDLPMVSEISERVIVFNRGRIAADASADTILSNQRLLEENDLT
jgi:cobalt/nickel transport system ATP-binding protein